MSKYTTEIRNICESLTENVGERKGYDNIDTLINAARPLIFSFSYPIFDTNYKPILEKKILKHYFTREISEETFGLWKLRLDTKMNEIMPYFNQLYESAKLEFNPFHDIDLDKNYLTTRDGKSQNNSSLISNEKGKSIDNGTHESKKLDMYSDTPQGALNEDDLFTSQTGATYLTNARKNKDAISSLEQIENENQSQNQGTEAREYSNTEEYLQHIAGKSNGRKTYSAMLQEYRNTFINIDMQVIDSLKDLFFNLW